MTATGSTVIPPGVVFVTGGARGLGNAVACAFAREGCREIVLVDILSDEAMKQGKREVEQCGAKCLLLKCDVTDENQVRDAVQQTVATFGRLDYAINAAGIQGPPQYVGDLDTTGFEKCLKVNTMGTLNCLKHQIQQMVKQEALSLGDNRQSPQRGAIVNFASVNSMLGGHNISAYVTSKHAIVGMTKAAAIEYRDKQIRINCLSPGYIWSAFAEQAIKAAPENQKRWEELQRRQGRVGHTQEIGDATVMLCSPRLSLVNAHNLVCDNGFSQNADSF
ncbi:uncharacterized protein Z518_03603 [Rhinocladiella mackenziei CBS 650.93]|uniref:Uncharacterized protein n=1 Tax=Rhinocladiella mackenziei CBS 650.93 TaxID=1442369 RepID=A0A0D2IR42_9EURO|nr:uncharacterized protein Z518_03603 [Rhinocladiella mackenziei CBS 650.93]KIX05631.1 hypothetical protein Z518_03603 [Rhinocladiella mackenziei CBS 650.93]